MRRECCNGVLVVVALFTWLLPLLAVAAPPSSLSADIRTGCPSIQLVRKTLAPLMPETKLVESSVRAGAIQSPGLVVELVGSRANGGRADDRFETQPAKASGGGTQVPRWTPTPATEGAARDSASLRVSVGGEARVFSPAPASCAERARLVAVFVHLSLEPLSLEVPATEDERKRRLPAARLPSRTVRPAPARRPIGLSMSVLSVAGAGGGAMPMPPAWGAGVRFFQHGRWATLSTGSRWTTARFRSLTAPAASPPASSTSSPRLRTQRLPVDVSVRLQQTDRAETPFGLRAYAELGPELALLWLSALGLEKPEKNLRLELAVRAALGVLLPLSTGTHVGLSARASLVPSPYTLQVDHQAGWGTTPRFWLGLAAELSLRL